LAGMIQRPGIFDPYRHPDRLKERRNLVLSLMRQNGYLTGSQYSAALNAPISLAPEQSEGLETQYFLDLVNDELQAQLDDHEQQTRYIYTTLDPDLQHAAEKAVRDGMQLVDQRLRGKKRGRAGSLPPGEPQVALVAIDPHTGEIKALVGGRNYDASQLDHAFAMRQPGSAFKPFVYAAALDTAVRGGPQIFTPSSIVDDTPTTFQFGRQVYQPGNFRQEFMGDVTLRTALAHSLNNASVTLAQQVGYRKVVALAHSAGLDTVEATPSLALGSYDTSPLELAGAYTVFANHGVHVAPASIALVLGRGGEPLYQDRVEARQVLDPRVAYLMVSMMEDVLRSGTGAGVRSLGFDLPAAGKTGTSRDGWFAGFTTQLLTVVWVGFDDDRDLNLVGARSALPIWADFMKRAARLRPYRDATAFVPPPGIVTVDICPDSGQLAGPNCPHAHPEVFIDGTQPVIECQLHNPQPAAVAGSSVNPAARSAAAVADHR